MKMGHVKISVYSPDLPVWGPLLQLRTDASIQLPWLMGEAARLRS